MTMRMMHSKLEVIMILLMNIASFFVKEDGRWPDITDINIASFFVKEDGRWPDILCFNIILEKFL